MVEAFGRRVAPNIREVGTKRANAKTFLKRFKPKGETVSPLFLKRMTAVAQRMAQDIANISPKCGK